MGFRWPHRWPVIAKDAFDPALVDHDEHGFSQLFIAEQDDRDRYLEDYFDNLPIAPPSRRFATKVVAASNSVNTAGADVVCTGTNDGATISSLTSSLFSAGMGGRILLMEGDYYIDTPNGGNGAMTLQDNIAIEGMGLGTVIHLRAANSVGIDGRANNVSISDLKIVGVARGTGTTAINLGSVSTSTGRVANVLINGLIGGSVVIATGIEAAGANMLIVNCEVNYCATVGIDMPGDDCLIVNCRLGANGGTGAIAGGGIRITGGNGSMSVLGCDFSHNNPGIYIQNFLNLAISGNNSTSDYNFIYTDTGQNAISITGNTIINSSLAALNLSFTSFSSITGNAIKGSGHEGILLTSCSDLTVANNSVVGSSQTTANTYDDIGVVSGTNVNLRDNICRSNATTKTRYGINVNGAGNTRVVMVGNDLHDANWGTGTFVDTGTGTLKNLDGSTNNWNLL